jgi:hypothetical protein
MPPSTGPLLGSLHLCAFRTSADGFIAVAWDDTNDEIDVDDDVEIVAELEEAASDTATTETTTNNVTVNILTLCNKIKTAR